MKIYKKNYFYLITGVITAVFISLVLILGLESVSYFMYGKYDFLLQEKKITEKEVPLYSKLDPLLGYTFNENIKLSDKFKHLDSTINKKGFEYKNGFVIFKHVTNVPPITIAILGGSATDSNLFNGNWPYFLHLQLKRNKISHIIYNGAISGYSSYQELLKLMRDVIPLKPDALIVYNGLNDCTANGDVVENHPFTHPYELRSYERLAGRQKKYSNSKYLPNLSFLYKKIINIFSHKLDISLGVENKNIVQGFINNIEYMKLIATHHKIKLYHFLQPIDYKGFSSGKSSVKDPHSDINKEKIISFFNKVQVKLENKPHSYSFFKLLDKNQNSFRDFGHLDNLGNDYVAQKVHGILTQEQLYNSNK